MLEELNCNTCGAPIQVPETARFVRCEHCKTNLQIMRGSGATFTEAVQQLSETTDSLAEQVEELKRQNRLYALDREWERQQQSMMVETKRGKRSPTEAGFSALVGVVVGAIVILCTLVARGPIPIVIVGGFIIVVSIIQGGKSAMLAGQYRQREADYHRRRDEILDED